MLPVKTVVVSPSKERAVPPNTEKVWHSPSNSGGVKEVEAEGELEAVAEAIADTLPEGDDEPDADSLAELDAELLKVADGDVLRLGVLACSPNSRF